MSKISVPIAVLAVLAVNGMIQNAHAQGGVMLLERAVAPAVRAMPTSNNAVKRESSAIETLRTDRTMPVPSNRPMAKGYLIHVQNNKTPESNRDVTLMPAQGAAVAPMSMSGFAPRPVGAAAPNTVYIK